MASLLRIRLIIIMAEDEFSNFVFVNCVGKLCFIMPVEAPLDIFFVVGAI